MLLKANLGFQGHKVLVISNIAWDVSARLFYNSVADPFKTLLEISKFRMLVMVAANGHNTNLFRTLLKTNWNEFVHLCKLTDPVFFLLSPIVAFIFNYATAQRK